MRSLALTLMVFLASRAWAHGEDKPGPHQGSITMPGPFHIELVAVNKRQLNAYLLDMNWKNPSVKDSSIAIKRGTVAAKCKAAENHYVCEFPGTVNLNALGELTVTATREKQKGNVVRYALPLNRNLKD